MSAEILVRSMEPSDVPTLVQYDTIHFKPGDQWPAKTFLRITKLEDRIGLVFQLGKKKKALGYFVLCIRPNDLAILRCSLPDNPEFSHLVPILMEWAALQARDLQKPALVMWCRESDLVTQLGLRDLGFICTKIVKSFYEQPTEDCYIFEKEIPLDG